MFAQLAFHAAAIIAHRTGSFGAPKLCVEATTRVLRSRKPFFDTTSYAAYICSTDFNRWRYRAGDQLSLPVAAVLHQKCLKKYTTENCTQRPLKILRGRASKIFST